MKKPLVFFLGLGTGLLLCAIPTIPSLLAALDGRTPSPPKFEDANLTRLPFDGDWYVSWGGENKADNHHWGQPPQDLALDIRGVIPRSGGRTVSGDVGRNESYGCWSRPIYSPINAVVEVAVDGVPDNAHGDVDNLSALGNHVILRDEKGFFVVMCHFKRGSVEVKSGQNVRTGDLIARCGNSGRSTEPHLHIHVQSGAVMAKSVALRMVFSSLSVSGVAKTNYTPKRGDVLAPIADTPNQALEPTSPAVTPRADARVAPAGDVAHL